MTFLLEMTKLGLGNLRLHMLRSILTALGIIFGVAAVITMVSIGEGSKRDALLQLEQLGAKNLIIRSKAPPETVQARGGQQQSWASKYGITREDLKVLGDSFPGAEAIVPLKSVGGQVLHEDRRITSQAFGTTPELLDVAKLRVERGRYLTQGDLDERAMVCVIGHEAAGQLFPFEDPLNKIIRVDAKTLRVIGVLAPVGLSGGAGGALVGRNLNLDVQLPITTADVIFGDLVIRGSGGSRQVSEVQVSEIYLATPSRDTVLDYAHVLKRIMDIRHPALMDISLIVPYELLEKAKRDALTWQVVLGAVAGISLLVGGIGIMNIMLASVTERTREIGIRRALGATRRHIVSQFLVETGVLSVIGGIAGVGLGVGLSQLIGWGIPLLQQHPMFAQLIGQDFKLPTHVAGWSLILAFTVATITGLVFGIYPAMRAAKQDPIVALRHD